MLLLYDWSDFVTKIIPLVKVFLCSVEGVTLQTNYSLNS